MAAITTRIPDRIAARLAKLAKRNERSVAAEVRVAIDRHLSESHSQEERKL